MMFPVRLLVTATVPRWVECGPSEAGISGSRSPGLPGSGSTKNRAEGRGSRFLMAWEEKANLAILGPAQGGEELGFWRCWF